MLPIAKEPEFGIGIYRCSWHDGQLACKWRSEVCWKERWSVEVKILEVGENVAEAVEWRPFSWAKTSKRVGFQTWQQLKFTININGLPCISHFAEHPEISSDIL
jgi:hypothetical protein